MAVFCLVFEIQRDIGLQSQFCTYRLLPFNLHGQLESRRIFFAKILARTARVRKLLDMQKYCRNVQSSEWATRTFQTDIRRQSYRRTCDVT